MKQFNFHIIIIYIYISFVSGPGQLAGAAALHVLLHLQGGALLVAGPGGDTALGHDYCHRPGPETKEM